MKFYGITSVLATIMTKNFLSGQFPLLRQARQGKFVVVLSDITIGKLQDATLNVRTLPKTIAAKFIELISITNEQLDLADNYVNKGALTPKYLFDAQHIALSTIIKADVLVTWNFKHMANFFRIKQSNSIILNLAFRQLVLGHLEK